ncbi:MAG: choice-of-anchor D domain-containing protein, partial [Candidatus Wildermuthbacteria bacterium]|nr:choice-of-anchor D domain-containing protein [Candidatus Wildermuthbacteria bacterium]
KIKVTPEDSTPNDQTLDFGNVTVGSSGTQFFLVENIGSVPLNVTGVLTGDPFVAVGPKSFSLASGEQRDVEFRFNPTAAGTVSAGATFQSNAGNAVLSVRGTGVGGGTTVPVCGNGTCEAGENSTSCSADCGGGVVLQAPILSSPANNATLAAPVTLQWNPVQGAPGYRVEVFNQRGDRIDFTNTSLSSYQASNANMPGEKYTWRAGTCNNASCTGNILWSAETRSFTIQASGAITGSIKINDDAATTNSSDVILNLTCVGCNEMRIANDNEVNLGGNPWEPFQNTRQWKLSIGGGQKSVAVDFKKGNNISVVYSDDIFVASGSVLLFSPANYSFPDTVTTQTSFPTRSFTTTHSETSGLGAVNGTIVTTGTSFRCIGNCEYTLRPGESKTVEIEFHPVATGDFTGTIKSNNASHTGGASLNGKGVQEVSVLSFKPASIDFGEVNPGETEKRVLIINNLSGSRVEGIISVSGSDSFSCTNNCNYALDPGDTQSVGIQFIAPTDPSGTTYGAVISGTQPGTATISAKIAGGGGGDNNGGGNGESKDSTTIRFKNPLGEGTTFTGLITKIVEFLITLALIILPIIIVWGGLMFLTAAGEPAKIQKAKQILTYSVIGFVIMLLSRAVIEFVQNLLGVK